MAVVGTKTAEQHAAPAGTWRRGRRRAAGALRLALAAALALAGVVMPATFGVAAPPAPVMTGYPTGAVGTDNAAFTFHVAGADSYECRVFATGTVAGSRPAFAACAGATQGYHIATAQPDGARTFEVRALDAGGAGPSVTHDWIVTSDPVVQWIVEPDGTYTATYVTATFIAAGATQFECRLDGGSYSSCGGGGQGYWTSTQLANGPHTLEVRADDGGGFGPVASAAFVVDAQLPVTWVRRPSGSYDTRFVAATFRAPSATSFDCRVYRTDPVPATLPDFAPCGNGRQGTWTSEQLADGAYRLEVRSADERGPASVASTDFDVGATLATSWVTAPSGTYITQFVTATFRAPAATAFDCRVYRTDPVPATLPDFAPCGNGLQGTWTSPRLVDGAYRLDVRAVDGAGTGAVASADFAVERPLVTEWIAQPSGTIDGVGVSATFSSAGATGFECRIDADPWASCGSGFQGTYVGAPADGSHTLSVRAVDALGAGPEVSTTFTIAPSAGSSLDMVVTSGPVAGSTIASSWAAFSFGASGAECVRVELDGPDADLGTVPCYSPSSLPYLAAYQSFASLADGPHVLRLQAQSAGVTYGAVLEHSFVVDSSSVTAVSVTSGPVAGSTIASSWAAFSFGASGAECVRVELDGPDADLGTVPCYSPSSLPYLAAYQSFASLADGPHVLRLQAQSAGVTYGAVLEHSFVVDSSSVTAVSVTSGPVAGSTIASSWAAFSFGASGAECVRVELDGPDADLGTVPCYSPSSLPYLGGVPVVHRARRRGAHAAVAGAVGGCDVWGGARAQFCGGFVVGDGGVGDVGSGGGVDDCVVVGGVLVRGVGCGVCAGGVGWAGCGSGDGAVLQPVVVAVSGGVPVVHRARRRGAHAAVAGAVDRRHRRPRPRSPVHGARWTMGRCVVEAPDGASVRYRCVRVRCAGGPVRAGGVGWAGCGPGDGAVLQRGVVAIPGRVSVVHRPRRRGAHVAVAGAVGGRHRRTGCERVVHGRDQGPGDDDRLGPTRFRQHARVPRSRSGPTSRRRSSVASTVARSFRAARPGHAPACPRASTTWRFAPSTRSATSIRRRPRGRGRSTPSHPPSSTSPGRSGSSPRPTPSSPSTPMNPRRSSAGSTALRSPPARASSATPAWLTATTTSRSCAIDRAGNVSAVAVRSWTVLTDPPETIIDSQPAALVNLGSATVTFSSPDSPVTFECALDGAAFTSCTSPWARSGLVDGNHTLAVRAVAAGALADPTPAAATWTVDTVAPSVTITAGPTGVVGVGASNFSFTANEPVSFSCVLDGGAPVACSSPRLLGALSGGSHTFTVQATDNAGNNSVPVSRTWTVDDVAPVVAITGGPADPTRLTDAVVSFTVDDPSATVECRRDAGGWAPCASPVSYAGFTDGVHDVQVRATDGAGNTSSIETWTWTVDTIAPVVTITNGPTGTVGVTSATVSFEVDDPTATSQCRIDGGGWLPCSSPVTFAALTDGPHTVEVRATDPAGNVSATAESDLDGRHHRTRRHDHRQSVRHGRRPRRDRHVHGRRCRCDDAMPPRRRCLGDLFVPGVVRRPRQRSSHRRDPGDGRRRQRRSGGERHVDGRHARTRHHHHVWAANADERERRLDRVRLRSGRGVFRLLVGRVTVRPLRFTGAAE